jgi:hypothetical protein
VASVIHYYMRVIDLGSPFVRIGGGQIVLVARPVGDSLEGTWHIQINHGPTTPENN